MFSNKNNEDFITTAFFIMLPLLAITTLAFVSLSNVNINSENTDFSYSDTALSSDINFDTASGDSQ